MISKNIALSALQIKFSSKSIQKNILVSLGSKENKEKMLPYMQKLSKLNVKIFSTIGTSEFLTQNGIENIMLHKISEKKEPNIYTSLADHSLDFVINILTGNHDYDENSDSNLIRSSCIEDGVVLISDPDIAILLIDKLTKPIKKQDMIKLHKSRPWDMKSIFLKKVQEKGGFCSYHAHFDKACLINEENLKLSQTDMQYKWELYKYLKTNYTHEDLVNRMSTVIEGLISQGVTYCRSFIDADSTIQLKGMNAALEVREKYKNDIKIEYAVQPLEGVLDESARKYFYEACKKADIIGGLPSKDRPTPEKHLDYILKLGKELGKPVDVHIDQENNPDEDETELLALKTIEHGMQGRVFGVHAISVSAKPINEQRRIAALVKEAGMNIVVCPSAALSMKQLDKKAPLHNSIAPLVLFLEYDIPVYLGIDNINDLFMPLVDGDMYFESRLLMEAARFYDIEKVSDIATDSSGYEKIK